MYRQNLPGSLSLTRFPSRDFFIDSITLICCYVSTTLFRNNVRNKPFIKQYSSPPILPTELRMYMEYSGHWYDGNNIFWRKWSHFQLLLHMNTRCVRKTLIIRHEMKRKSNHRHYNTEVFSVKSLTINYIRWSKINGS